MAPRRSELKALEIDEVNSINEPASVEISHFFSRLSITDALLCLYLGLYKIENQCTFFNTFVISWIVADIE